MHIGTVHRNHYIEMTHQDELLRQTCQRVGHIDTLRLARNDIGELFSFGFAASEEKYPARGMPFYQQLNHLLHLRERVNLAFVGGKWCNANPLAERLLGADDCGKECQIASACGENRPEIELYGITQACKYVGIILKRGGLLQQLLIVFRGELSLPSAVFIDVCHSVAAEIEPQSQVFRLAASRR